MAKPKGTGRSLTAEALRRWLGREEFDYLALMETLKGYARPRDKVTALLREGSIVRVKKGLYVFSPEVRRSPISLEVLANTIYGPSCISLQFALAHHGLIPEGVHEVTSVTTGRKKTFDTPLGRFTYRSLPERAYWVGVDRMELEGGRAFLMAVPEKALADTLYFDRGSRMASTGEVCDYLISFLRVDQEALTLLNLDVADSLAGAYASRRVTLLAGALRELKTGGHRE